MSDTSQGPGWWQASDGKWYPPEQAPGYQPPAAAPGGVPGAAPAGGPPSVDNFDVGAAFNWTWAKFQQNMQPLLILGAVVVGIPFLINMVGFFTSSVTIDLVMAVLAIAVGFILPFLVTQNVLKIANGQSIDTSQMFAIEGNIGGYVVGAILFAILAVIGFCLFCIGYIFVWLIFGLWNFVVLDRGVSGVEGLTTSKDLTLTPGLGKTFIPMILYMLIYSVGSGIWGAAGSGLFVSLVGIFTVPFAFLFGAYVYKTFSGQAVAA